MVSYISPGPSHPPGFAHMFVCPSPQMGPVRNCLGMAQGDDQAYPMGPLPSNSVIVRILPPSFPSPVIFPDFLACPPINSIWEDYPL